MRCPLDISNTRNDSKNGIILVFILGINSWKIFSEKIVALAEIRTADLIHDLSSLDDDLDRSTTVADMIIQSSWHNCCCYSSQQGIGCMLTIGDNTDQKSFIWNFCFLVILHWCHNIVLCNLYLKGNKKEIKMFGCKHFKKVP